VPADQQILEAGTAAVPLSYTVPPTIEASLLCVNATFDGTAASGTFYPTVEIISDGGKIVARCPCFTAVAPGGAAEVSWFRLRNSTVEPAPGSPYEEVILARTDLRIYWKLDEIGGTTAFDSSGNGLHGTFSATGMSIQQPALADGYAFSFTNAGRFGHNWDGTPDSVVQINEAAVPAPTGNHLSIETWIKTTQGGGADPYWLSLSGSATFASPLAFIHLTAAGKAIWSVYDEFGTEHTVTSATTVNDGVRHQVGATYDGTTISIYVDGALDGTTASAFNLYPVGGSATRIMTVAGRQLGAAIWQSGYTGVADEISYYTGTLTAADYAASWAARN